MSATQWVGLAITAVAWVWTIGMVVSSARASRRRAPLGRQLDLVLAQHHLAAEHVTTDVLDVMCTCGWSITISARELPPGITITELTTDPADALAAHVGFELRRAGLI